MSKRSWKKISKIEGFAELTPKKASMLKAKLNQLRETQTKKRDFIQSLLEKPIAQVN